MSSSSDGKAAAGVLFILVLGAIIKSRRDHSFSDVDVTALGLIQVSESQTSNLGTTSAPPKHSETDNNAHEKLVPTTTKLTMSRPSSAGSDGHIDSVYVSSSASPESLDSPPLVTESAKRHQLAEGVFSHMVELWTGIPDLVLEDLDSANSSSRTADENISSANDSSRGPSERMTSFRILSEGSVESASNFYVDSFRQNLALLQSQRAWLHSVKASRKESEKENEGGGGFSSILMLLLILLILGGAAVFALMKYRPKVLKRLYDHTGWRDLCPDSVKRMLVKVGVDKYEDFNVQFLVHEVLTNDKVETYVVMDAGDGEVKSCISYRGNSKQKKDEQSMIFEDVLHVKVPQGCEKIRVALVRKKNLEPIAGVSISIKDVMKDTEETTHEYQMKMLNADPKRSTTTKGDPPVLFLSWTFQGSCTDAEVSEKAELLLLDGMDSSQWDENFKIPLERAARKLQATEGSERIEAMTFREKSQLQLSLLAQLVQGKLTVKTGMMGKKKQYFFAIYNEEGEGAEAKLGAWNVGWWEYNEQTEERGARVGSIPVLSVTKVDSMKSENSFVLSYKEEGKDKEKQQEYISRDLNKDYWVHGISAFIDHTKLLRKKLLDMKESKGLPKANKETGASASSPRAPDSARASSSPRGPGSPRASGSPREPGSPRNSREPGSPRSGTAHRSKDEKTRKSELKMEFHDKEHHHKSKHEK